MRIRSKIVGLGVASAAVVGLTLGLYMARASAESSERSLLTLDRTLREDFDRNAKLEVETTISMLQLIADRAARGEINLDEAKRQGAALLRGLRYGKDGYFWADTVDGTNVVLLGRADEGKNRLQKTDSGGKRFVEEFLSKGRAGGGFIDYTFTRVAGGAPVPKRAYTLQFAPFGWVVGTGNYVDDIDALVGK